MVLLKELQDSGTAGGLCCAVKLAHDLLSNLFCRLESITNLFILLLQKSCLNVQSSQIRNLNGLCSPSGYKWQPYF